MRNSTFIALDEIGIATLWEAVFADVGVASLANFYCKLYKKLPIVMKVTASALNITRARLGALR